LEWAQIPVVQLGAVGVVFAIVWLVVKGILVPRAVLEDARKDAEARATQAEKDRDERVAEAEKDCDQWRLLFDQERSAHETTRQAHAEEIRAALLASTEGAQIAAALLTEIRARQLEGNQ
jgi:flagellar biosynthesis/type III secretory pathway M-ring protein FliF/YscJ